jgi:lactate racemase
MIIDLVYGENKLKLDVPDRNLLGILKPNDMTGLKVCKEDISGLRAGVREFAGTARSLLIVVNDYTRPTPNEEILDLIAPELPDKELWFLIACGSHVAPNEAQYRQVLGRFYDQYRDHVVVHDSKQQSALKFIGKTSRGTEAWVNDLLFKTDRMITINSVEPHYFAGYTGGRKSILPGISGYDSITQNHRLSLNPAAKTLALKGNPVHEDMTEVARMVPRGIFSIQVIIDNNHNLCTVKYGDIFQSFEEAVHEANKVFCVPIKEKADIVIAVARAPYDVNFYQQQKSLENGKLALRDGGILIGMSPCRTGIGDGTFLKQFATVKTPGEVIEKIRRDFVLGYHKTAKLAEMMLTCEIWNVAGVPDDIVRSAFMTPYPDIEAALTAALRRKGPDAKVIVLPDAALTVPLAQ